MVPALHVAGVFLHVSHQALDAVGSLEAFAQFVEESKSVERQRLFQSFLERTSGLAVDMLEFNVEIGEPLFSGLVAGFLVSSLEFGPPRFLVGLRNRLSTPGYRGWEA
jgi:hypothetical protein